MPCYDARDSKEYPSAELIYTNRQLQDRLDEMARMLCASCAAIEDLGYVVPLIVKDWWEKHKAFDKERLRKEKVKQDALNKLNHEEKQLLGIKL